MRGTPLRVAALVVAIFIAMPAAGASRSDKSDPVRVWAVNYKGTLRCTATFPHGTLKPGHKTHVSITVTNLTDHRKNTYGFGYLEFRDQERNLLWDSSPRTEGPVPGLEVGPHQTKRMISEDARVRWSGPLFLTPVCGGLKVNMPEASFDVAQPGAPDNDSDAIDAAVSVTGSPFQACHPGSNGEARTGSMAPPTGRDEPDMTFRCWAEVRHEQGFDVVALNMVSPEDAPDYTIDESQSGFFPSGNLPGNSNMLAGRWGFVVTSSDARGYISLTDARATNGEGKIYSYNLRDGEWTIGGGGTCNFTSSSQDVYGNSFFLEWLPDCT
jgi:hypothetical protein